MPHIPESPLAGNSTMSGAANDTGVRLIGQPDDGQSAHGPFVFTFSQPVKLAPGGTLTFSTVYGVQLVVPLSGNPHVTHQGAVITYAPPQPLRYAMSYSATFDATAILDLDDKPLFGGHPVAVEFDTAISPVAVFLVGTDRSERLDGSDAGDTIDGGAGRDTIVGYGGDDLLRGGSDAGPLFNAADILDGRDGNDTLWGDTGNDSLYGGNGNDRLYGEADDDELDGGAGDDLLDGGAGNDRLFGGEGHNQLIGGDGNDILTNGPTATGSLEGGAGDDALNGSAGSRYAGGIGNDRIWLTFDQQSVGTSTAEGGDGNDEFHLYSTVTKAGLVTLTGGSGTDTYIPAGGGGFPEVRVNDFTAGAGGDQIDLRELFGVFAGNPFDDGRIRLVTSGTDTLLQQRQFNGTEYTTLLRLLGVKPEQLTSANFSGGYNPHGGTTGSTITGTSGADSLRGTGLDETLLGLDGDDQIDGWAGNDVLEGGEGNDRLDGGEGNDTLRGGNGDDQLTSSFGGVNLLDGGAGRDVLSGGDGNDTLLGGDGDDLLILASSSGQAHTVTLEGGTGNDILRVNLAMNGVAARASGGDGADTFELLFAGTPLTITDFTSADKIDLRSLLPTGLSGNPFGASGYLKAVQSGTDVQIHIDQDGASGPGNASLLLTMRNVALASLGTTQFVGDYSPSGNSTGLALTGTPGNDVLRGSDLDDIINGADGADQLFGNGGDDVLDGGDESAPGTGDYIDGGDGNDTLRGGGGNDSLRGWTGNDLLEGGSGDDALSDGEGNNILRGGDGNDTLEAENGAGNSQLDGGAGRDTLMVGGNAGTALGGAGDDDIVIQSSYAARGGLRAEGGDGNDSFRIDIDATGWRSVVLAGGSGVDRYSFVGNANGQWGALTITDFKTGAGGDVLDVLSLFPDVAGNPFGNGHVRLVQEGSRVLLQRDPDGNAGPLGFGTQIVFENAGVGNFMAENFAGARPDGSNAGLLLTGTGGHDTLAGGRLDDTLVGNAGDDQLTGNEGNDRLSGGEGWDRLDGGEGNDHLDGGDGNDLLQDEAGNNVLIGGDGNDSISTGDKGYNEVSGGNGDDRLYASAGGLFDGGNGNDEIQLTSGFSSTVPETAQVRGGSGNDLIRAALDTHAILHVRAEGGAGSDVFSLAHRPLAGSMTVTDFAVGAGGDRIDVSGLGQPSGRNPFAPDGYLRLVQRGADTVLQVRDSTTWHDAMVLQNTAKVAFTADNFVLGLNPDGSDTGRSITGTSQAERLNGGLLDDKIDGGGGEDVLLGGKGNDILSGGEGNDELHDDTLDYDETPFPAQGWPWPAGNDRLEGGAGDDYLTSSGGNDILSGGDGNDRLHIVGTDRTATVTLTGGAGSDVFGAYALPGGNVTVLDFKAGAGGDVLDIFELIPFDAQPFAQGYYTFEQRGADTVIRFDADGAAGAAYGLENLLTLRNVSFSSLTASNLRGGLLPGDPVLPGKTINGAAGADQLIGGSGNDNLAGGAGNDTLAGNGGADRLDGGAGTDTAILSGAQRNYQIDLQENFSTISDLRGGIHDGRDQLIGIERLRFSDGALGLDVDGPAGQAFRLYRAAFDREPDHVGLGFWIEMLDRGVSLQTAAGGFTQGEEFARLYGVNPSNADIVTRLYRNILDREPEQGGYEFWLSVLDNRLTDLGTVLAAFSESNENRTAVAELIANGVNYQPYTG